MNTETEAADRLARVLDPVAFDQRATAGNVGQEWDRTSRQMAAWAHAERAIAAGYQPDAIPLIVAAELRRLAKSDSAGMAEYVRDGA